MASLNNSAGASVAKQAPALELNEIQATVLRVRPAPYFGTHLLFRIDDAKAADNIRELTGGIGATFILDCVGVNATLATAVAALSWRGRLAVVGAGGGSIPFDFFKAPPGAQLMTSLNGGSIALMDVVQMATLGRLKIPVDRYPLSAAKKGYDDFEHGRLVGRAVLMPGALNGADGAASATS